MPYTPEQTAIYDACRKSQLEATPGDLRGAAVRRELDFILLKGRVEEMEDIGFDYAMVFGLYQPDDEDKAIKEVGFAPRIPDRDKPATATGLYLPRW